MSRTNDDISVGTARAPRFAPSIGIALAVVLGYSVIFTATAASSGIPYTEWFDSAPNVWRTAVLPLVFGAVFLVAFLAWARWDGVFRDRERLSVPRFLWVAVAVFAIGFVAHLLFVGWGQLSIELVVPILAAGILVGFTEETLFRGILLRGFRTKGRSEAVAAIGTSVLFGLFHLTNIINGSPLAATLSQVLIATCSGAILYAFRRVSGLLVVAMIAHGAWDTSVFLPSAPVTDVASLVNLVLLVLVPAIGLATLVVIGVRDRRTPAVA